MKSVDYIIVGCGLAGIALCEKLRDKGYSFLVFDDSSQQSSRVAAGLYNPVILKRFSEVWQAKTQLDMSLPVYKKIEQDLNITIDYKLRLLRKFASVEEQNMWFNASDIPKLEPFLSTKLVKNDNNFISAPYGFGEVLQAGRLDTKTLISAYKDVLRANGFLREKRVLYKELIVKNEIVQYANIRANHIVFAEGFGVRNNPFFKYLPINGTKGEVLTIKAPKLKLNAVVKSSVFVIPLGNDLYTVGSTYNWTDKSNTPTTAAKNELLAKLKTLISCNFEVVAHNAGIRPTVKDRRPLVGRHPKHKNLYILNGLGTRGVMIAPYVAHKLFHYIEKNQPLDAEIDIKRFTS